MHVFTVLSDVSPSMFIACYTYLARNKLDLERCRAVHFPIIAKGCAQAERRPHVLPTTAVILIVSQQNEYVSLCGALRTTIEVILIVSQD